MSKGFTIKATAPTPKKSEEEFDIEEDDNGGVGYIRIVAFNNQTTTELKKAVDEIEKKLQKKYRL